MRTITVWADEKVEAYENSDIENIRTHLTYATNLWFLTWSDQGGRDYGTCTGGKGLEIWYVAPRKRKAKRVLVVKAPPVQGNLAAADSRGPAMEYLESKGIKAFYNDGWMD